MGPRGFGCGLVALVVGCSSPSPRERFDRAVAPILERRCAAPTCHGVAPGAEAAGEVIDRTRFFLALDGGGRLADLDAAYRTAKLRLDTVERAEYSTLLRKPLALEAGGLAHEGGHFAATRSDPDWSALRAWAASESGGGEGAAASTLTSLQTQFAREVLPVLDRRGCMVARCHGPMVMFGGLSFQPPIDGSGGAFSTQQIIANYRAARHNLALTGDGSRSRLLVKALPLDAGGVIHRGGNDGFFAHDGLHDPREQPGARAIVAWADAERAAAVGPAAAQPAGLIFVRGPIAPHDFLALDSYRPGSDLWFYPGLVAGRQPVNLTARLHLGSRADIRDPAVSHDGQRVVFSMRTSEDDCHNLYEISLNGPLFRALTFDRGTLPGGGKVVNRWPGYGPGGRIYFASTRAGVVDETARALDSDLYALQPSGEVIRLTSTPTPELAPSFLATGEFRGTLAFTVLRRLNGFDASIFRFPPDRAKEHPQADYHPHTGQTAPGEVTWGLRELPDGRDVAALFDHDAAWEGGALAVIERQLGPDLSAAQAASASLPGFRHGVSLIAPTATTSGSSPGGLYRDPLPLPDGRIVVAWAPGPVALADPAPARPPDTGLYLARLATAADGAVTIAGLDPLVDAPGLADDQPALVAVRPEEDDPHPWAWDPAATTGRLHLAGGATIAVVEQGLRPSGAKLIPPGLGAGIRLLLAPAVHPADGRPVDPAQIANHDAASTWWSNGVHAPLLLLAEAPLAADASIYVQAPAGAPVRAQVLDPAGFAVGRQIAFWLFLPGGWQMSAGAPLGRYGLLCAGCHGAIDGDPAHALPPIRDTDVDTVASASITLSSHQGRDPRRPLAPIVLGTTAPPSFHFRRDLGPILVRSCALASCHAGSAPAGGLDLTPTPTAYYDRAYEALQAFGDGSTGGKRYVDERGASAHGSYLMEKLTGHELGAPRVLDFQCPPPGTAPALSDEEVRAFLHWIDLGAIYRTPGVVEP